LSTILSNKAKGRLGEAAVSTSPSLKHRVAYHNLPTDKYGGDIDHLATVDNTLLFIETKNVNENFKIYSGWARTHIIDRFTKGAATAKLIAKSKHIRKVLIISVYKPASKKVDQLIRGLDIEIIETGKQALSKQDFTHWHNAINRFVKTIADALASVVDVVVDVFRVVAPLAVLRLVVDEEDCLTLQNYCASACEYGRNARAMGTCTLGLEKLAIASICSFYRI